MSRYIDADSLIKTLYIQSDDDGFICCGAEDLDALIQAQPTADVREIVRGEWIKFDEGNTVCSLCGYELEDWTQGIFYSYCPKCGADMRGDENERTD